MENMDFTEKRRQRADEFMQEVFRGIFNAGCGADIARMIFEAGYIRGVVDVLDEQTAELLRIANPEHTNA